MKCRRCVLLVLAYWRKRVFSVIDRLQQRRRSGEELQQTSFQLERAVGETARRGNDGQTNKMFVWLSEISACAEKETTYLNSRTASRQVKSKDTPQDVCLCLYLSISRSGGISSQTYAPRLVGLLVRAGSGWYVSSNPFILGIRRLFPSSSRRQRCARQQRSCIHLFGAASKSKLTSVPQNTVQMPHCSGVC